MTEIHGFGAQMRRSGAASARRGANGRAWLRAYWLIAGSGRLECRWMATL